MEENKFDDSEFEKLPDIETFKANLLKLRSLGLFQRAHELRNYEN